MGGHLEEKGLALLPLPIFPHLSSQGSEMCPFGSSRETRKTSQSECSKAGTATGRKSARANILRADVLQRPAPRSPLPSTKLLLLHSILWLPPPAPLPLFDWLIPAAGPPRDLKDPLRRAVLGAAAGPGLAACGGRLPGGGGDGGSGGESPAPRTTASFLPGRLLVVCVWLSCSHPDPASPRDL